MAMQHQLLFVTEFLYFYGFNSSSWAFAGKKKETKSRFLALVTASGQEGGRDSRAQRCAASVQLCEEAQQARPKGSSHTALTAETPQTHGTTLRNAATRPELTQRRSAPPVGQPTAESPRAPFCLAALGYFQPSARRPRPGGGRRRPRRLPLPFPAPGTATKRFPREVSRRGAAHREAAVLLAAARSDRRQWAAARPAQLCLRRFGDGWRGAAPSRMARRYGGWDRTRLLRAEERERGGAAASVAAWPTEAGRRGATRTASREQQGRAFRLWRSDVTAPPNGGALFFPHLPKPR